MLIGVRGFAASVFLLACAPSVSAAISIQYTVVPVGGNIYRYVYSITNSGSGPAVQLFDILFDTSLYQQGSLQIVTPAPLNTQWSQQILSSIPPSIPAAYDALALAGGIPAGATVSGFSVQFVWLGGGVPGAQPFQIFNLSDFSLLQSGTTSAAPNVGIPAASPVSLGLLGVTLSIAAALQARRRTPAAIRLR